MNHERSLGCVSTDFAMPGAERHYPPDLGLEPFHLDITMGFDIPGKKAEGRVVLSLRANRSGVKRLKLHARDFEDIEVSDAEGGPVEFSYDGRAIRITFAEALEKGETRDLAVAYRVEEPVSGLIFSVPDDTYPDRAFFVATDHETERARYWLPCIDLPAVRTTLAFHLTAPEDLTILANGLRESEASNGDGTKTAHWRLDWPCPSYLVCMAIGKFERADDEDVGGREIAYFGAAGRTTSADLAASFGRTPRIMRWLEERLGVPFPFPKYFQFALPQFGGAMENISLVSWDDMFAADEEFRGEIVDLIDVVNVHEMAHSYFGDAVVIRDFAHAWLKESWASYMESCWREYADGEDEFLYSLFTKSRTYMEEADRKYKRPIVTRVFDSSWDMYDRHLYPGGAMRLHMLRRLLTDEVFWPAVGDYLKTFTKRTVETEDFRKKLEEHSGRSLLRFFDQWVYGKGYPNLKVEFKHDAGARQGTFAVEQKQVPPKEPEKGQEAPRPFHLEFELAWEATDGEWRREKVELDRRRQTYTFPMEEPPRQVRVDPGLSLLARIELNPGDGMLRRSLRHAPDVVGRILAAEALAATGKPKNLTEIAGAIRDEPFWGARLQMAKFVADTKSAAAVDFLTDLLGREEDPRVLAALAESCASYRDPRIAAALESLLDRRPPYRVASTALRSLGAQRGAEHLERLTSAAGDGGFRSIVRAGALAGLAETRTEEAFELLLGRNRYGAETADAAPAAAASLASIARFMPKHLKERAVERLIDLLRDPRDRVRQGAIAGLGMLRAGEAAEAIERTIATLPEQAHPRVVRTLKNIRAETNGKADTTALTERLEKLEERNRKLEERLARLEKDAESPGREPTPA